jgi:Second Messenger Oligonucleotide or Dinucleotide Synthetase domain
MAKTVEEGFETLIGWLKPLTSEREKSTIHKSTVNSCLTNNFGCTSLFETGSFGNGTGVRHYSDTDYFAVIPAENLHDNSATSLRLVKEALQSTFSSTSGIVVSCPAVKIPFGTYKSEDLEVTPCCYNGLSETSLGNFRRYEIPDCNSGWMFSSPKAHNEYVEHHDKRLNRKLKPLIQLVKAWKYYNDVPIISFYLELRVTKYAESETVIVYDIDLKNILNKLQGCELASIRDPMGVSGLIPCSKTSIQKQTALSKLNTAVTRAEKAMTAKHNERFDDAFYWWNLLFNNKFPSK